MCFKAVLHFSLLFLFKHDVAPPPASFDRAFDGRAQAILRHESKGNGREGIPAGAVVPVLLTLQKFTEILREVVAGAKLSQLFKHYLHEKMICTVPP